MRRLLLHAPNGPAWFWIPGLQPGLTSREREILISFARGISYARIEKERETKSVTARNAVKEMVGRDISDIFGTTTFEATPEGTWVTTEDLSVSVVSDAGMTFGSGWHRSHDEAGG